MQTTQRRTTMSRHRLILGLFALVLLAGCAGRVGSGADATTPAAAAGFDGEWRLTAGTSPSGRIPVPNLVTLTIAGQTVSGTSACNQYSGNVTIDGSSFAAGQIAGTEMGCPGKRMIAEQRYGEALMAADTIGRDGDTLALTGPGVDLQFEPVVPPEPAPFEDTKWALNGLIEGTGPDGAVSSMLAPATLTFAADGTLIGETGCRSLEATWSREGDVVTVSDVPMVDIDCPVAGPQDDHIVDVLTTPFTAALDVRRLTLTQVDGDLGLDLSAD
jgi:heat shock protein HslJ